LSKYIYSTGHRREKIIKRYCTHEVHHSKLPPKITNTYSTEHSSNCTNTLAYFGRAIETKKKKFYNVGTGSLKSDPSCHSFCSQRLSRDMTKCHFIYSHCVKSFYLQSFHPKTSQLQSFYLQSLGVLSSHFNKSFCLQSFHL
jgi:hypothetical protein